MTLSIYAIKDSLLGDIITPMYAFSEKEAKESFKEMIKQIRKNNPRYKKIHIELWKIGEIDRITGELKENKYFVMNATEGE